MSKQLELEFSSTIEPQQEAIENKPTAKIINFCQQKKFSCGTSIQKSYDEIEKMHRRIDSLLARYK